MLRANAKTLTKTLTLAAKFADTSKAALACHSRFVLSVYEGGEADVQTSDGSTWATIPLEVLSSEPFRVAVGIKFLKDALKGVSGVIELIDREGAFLTFRIEGGGSMSLPKATLPGDDYLPPSLESDSKLLNVDAPAFCALVNSVHVSAAKESFESRAVMRAVQIEVDDAVTAVATDGRRMHVASTYGFRTGASHELMISAAVVEHVASVIKDSKEEAAIRSDSKYAQITCEGFELTTVLYVGRFPDWRKIVPDERRYNTRFNMDAKSLSTTVKNAVKVSGKVKKTTDLVVFEIEKKNRTKLSVTANGYEEDDVFESAIPAKLEGKPIRVGFNGQYILEALKSLGSERVIWSMQCETKATRLEPAERNPLLSSQTVILMPVKLRDIAADYEENAH